MTRNTRGNLRLGSNVIELLLPQRRPFLMVDFTTDFEMEPAPTIRAGRHISANESVFEGHFPEIHIWPGTHTIEGLGQSSALLMAILMMRRKAEAEGQDAGVALEMLRNLNLAYRLHPGHQAAQSAELLRRMNTETPWLAIGGSVEMKFLHPVFAGERLDYRCTLIGELGDMMRFSCEAQVESRTVAVGTLSGARIAVATPPRGRSR